MDKIGITTDDILTYKITIVSAEKKLAEPKVPEFKGFRVESIAQSSSVSIAKNGINATLVYAFILAPTDTGKFQIEPSRITIKGKTYSSEAFEIEVKQGKSKPQATPLQPETEEPQTTL